MKPISQVRFNALAGYARKPETLFLAEEVAWFEHANERVLGTVIRDREDGDYSGITLAKDRKERYRAIDLTKFLPSIRHAQVDLRRAMERLAMASEEKYFQDDEEGEAIDFFEIISKPKDLNPSFQSLTENEKFSPARDIIVPMMKWHDDVDGNFIQQFQTTGFDARIWELYLFAVFTELGYFLDKSNNAPDFDCRGIFDSFLVEAVTVNPTRDKNGQVVPPPSISTPEQKLAYIKEYMPIKYASSLTSKLRKEYWKKEHVKGKPFMLAIQDFSSPASMTYSRSALPLYLYGTDYQAEKNDAGELTIIPQKKETHQWGKKTIPSGFFSLPDSENISAVLFNNSGTISKFNRMGVLGNFGSSNVLLVREGTVVDHDPNAEHPQFFRHNVNDESYTETWTEGLDVFHNPHAKHPIHPNFLPGAAHHQILPDGQMNTLSPDWHPLGSITQMYLKNEIKDTDKLNLSIHIRPK